MNGLADRIILVAGAATGIGAASARRLAAEGAKVVIGDLNLDGAETTAHEIENAGGAAIAIQYDQADEDSIAKLVAQTVAHFGCLNGLHANAADLRPELFERDVDVARMDVAVWERTLRVDLIGYAIAIREVIPHLLSAGGGGIVCTSTGGGSPPIGRDSLPVAYASAKAGVNQMCRHVASRWGKEGIRCNAVSPGVVLTDAARSVMSQEFINQLLGSTRSPRLGVPADIAGAVAFLLSDDGAWVNGQVWGVNGGMALIG